MGNIPAGYRLIFRAYFTDKEGKKHYAKDYGKKAWPLLVPIKKTKA